jgi:hypothetical protein
MTFDDLGARIAAMTPEQRKRPAVATEHGTGSVSEISDIIPIDDFNGRDLPHQWVMWVDTRNVPKVF